MKKTIIVNDKMQKRYKYELSEAEGKNFHPDFHPELTPREMLELGVFGGRYIRDCKKEFPASWFKKAKLHPTGKPGHSPEKTGAFALGVRQRENLKYRFI